MNTATNQGMAEAGSASDTPITFTLDKQTAKDICAVRKAQNVIDSIELGDEWGKFKPPDAPNIAYLKNGTMFPPFRCDIVAKWVAIADRQSFGIDAPSNWKPDDTIYFTPRNTGEIELSCGQSSVRLYAIKQGNNPPVHPLPITVDNGAIKLAFNPKEITDKAKLLTSNAARIKKQKAEQAAAKAEQVALAEYERCQTIVTPEAIRACTKRVKRLRALTNWLRKVSEALDAVPSLPQLIANPLFNAFDPEYSEVYGDARLAYLEAVRRRDNFKPRSWRSSGLEKHNENVKLAFHKVCETALNALEHNVQASGFSLSRYANTARDARKYYVNDVRRCREYMRQYEREHLSS